MYLDRMKMSKIPVLYNQNLDGSFYWFSTLNKDPRIRRY